MGILTKAEIRDICLANGFKTKPQPDGTDDLNPYVYDAVNVAVNEAMRKTVEFKVDLSDYTNAPDEEENLPSNAQFYFLNELDQLLTAGKTVALQHVEFIDALQALRKYALSGRYGGKLCGFEFEPIGKRSVKIKHVATDKFIDVVEQWVTDPRH